MNFILSTIHLKNVCVFVLVISISAFLASCEKEKALEIYNPHLTSIEVNLYGESYIIYGNSFKDLKLKLGSYDIKVFHENNLLLDTEIKITEDHKKNGAFLNLTKQDLVIYQMTYGTYMYNQGLLKIEEELEKKLKELEKTDSLSYQALLEKQKEKELLNQKEQYQFIPAEHLLIVKDWYYDINRPLPEEVSFSVRQSHIKRKKLFTYDNFVKYLEEIEANY